MKFRQQFFKTSVLLVLLWMLFPAFNAAAESDEEELAKKSLNPVAAMISLPLQFNQDYGIGPGDDAKRTYLNIQPVIPLSLGQDMNVIIRTIVPLIHAESPLRGGDDASGLGDITQSFFLSPKEPVGGWIMGFGPVFLYPTATDDDLGKQEVGSRPDGCCAEAGKRLYLRPALQPHLVLCRG